MHLRARRDAIRECIIMCIYMVRAKSANEETSLYDMHLLHMVGDGVLMLPGSSFEARLVCATDGGHPYPVAWNE